MLRVFIGFDERQRVSLTTLASSIFELSSQPVSITPLVLRTLPITRRGLTPFTYSRFLVPWLCNFEGTGIFLDADMLLVSDIAEVCEEIKYQHAIGVVTDIAQFEQTSFTVFNCAHPSNRKLTPEYIQSTSDNLHALSWVNPDEIASLDPKWNQLIGYQDVDASSGNLHYTMGIPAYPETATCELSNYWSAQLKLAISSAPWAEIMGASVHAIEIDKVKFPKYVWDFDNNQPKPEHIDLIKTVIAEHGVKT